MAQRIKCQPAMRETQVRSLGREDPLEKKMATHSSILAWRIPWMEEPGGLQFSSVAQSCPTLGDSMDCREYWSGLPSLSPGDLPDPGIEPGSPALQAVALTSEPLGKPKIHL